MPKTDATISLERKLWYSTRKLGTFACFEVTIGIHGTERVDYLSWETKGIWRAYEIKTSKADFRSNAAKSFVGNYNYFVMPETLYEQVKDEIPDGIGVHTGSYVIRPPKYRELSIPHDVLLTSMMRSLYRDAEPNVMAGFEQTEIKAYRIKKEREKNRYTIRSLRNQINSYRSVLKRQGVNDYERNSRVLDYWKERAQNAEKKLKEKL